VFRRNAAAEFLLLELIVDFNCSELTSAQISEVELAAKEITEVRQIVSISLSTRWRRPGRRQDIYKSDAFQKLARLFDARGTDLVHDGGAGISRAMIGKIFEPFFSTKENKGTGLGLWVIRNLISKYRGNITVHSTSRPSRCTSFSVFLPAEIGLGRVPPNGLNSATKRNTSVAP
jgi:nitrogen-specific signal transduction histidine kinase